jgi:chromate reductase
MADPKLLTMSGSLRAGSYNRMLLREAVRAFGPAEVTEANLQLPLYDGDLEDAQGVPAAVHTLVDQIRAADGVVIASPEYNKGITGAMKNALDWISRVQGPTFKSKPTVVMSANAGRTGGEAGQFMLISCLTPLQADILPGPMLCVAAAGDEFDADGKLGNAQYQKALTAKMEALRARLS